MERRAFLLATTLCLPGIRTVRAQLPAKQYRLGMISSGNPRSAPFYAAFEEQMRKLGWIDGKNLNVDFEVGETPEQLSQIALRMVQRNVDAILAVGPEGTLRAASAATRSIPIVTVALNYDPVEKGYVAGLARPGGNITGVFFRNSEVGAKQLEFLRQAFPNAKRVAVLWTTYSADQIPALDAAASQLRIRLDKFELAPPYDIGRTFAAMKARHLDAVLAVGDPVVYRERNRIAKSALEQSIPVVGGFFGVEAGFPISFGPNLNGALRSSAVFVDKVLKGMKPSDLPIEQPNKFELVINLKTARSLGITIPQSILVRADEVIQ